MKGKEGKEGGKDAREVRRREGKGASKVRRRKGKGKGEERVQRR